RSAVWALPPPSQPSVENGQRPLENHVSSTSVSWRRSAELQRGQAVGVSRATMISLHSPQCQAGMRWPHQSWREMHQSRMLYIHSKYVLDQLAGTNSMRPFSTTSMAFSASGLVLTNHCVEMSGSTGVLQRSHLPRLRV